MTELDAAISVSQIPNQAFELPCGHQFCRRCLEKNSSDYCQICQDRFKRPPLGASTDTAIAENSHQKMEEEENGVEEEQEEEEEEEEEDERPPVQVRCHMCLDQNVTASKSCLVCMTSFCEAHLERHRTVANLRRHRLIDPVEDLGEPTRVTSFFCNDDGMFACRRCKKVIHKDHKTVPVEEEEAAQDSMVE